MNWKARAGHAILWLGLALLLALPALVLHLSAAPIVIEDAEGDARIAYTTDRDRFLLPGECVNVHWQVEGIQAVLVDGQGVVGEGSKEVCGLGSGPTLSVKLRDGTIRDYPLRIQRLYTQPVLLALMLLAAAAVCGAAYALVGAPGVIAGLIVIIFGPMLYIAVHAERDFLDHLVIVQRALDTGSFSALPPHFLYHVLIIAVSRIMPGITLVQSNFIVILSAYILTGLAIYALLTWLTGCPSINRKSAPVYIGLTLGLMLIGAINIFDYPRGNYLFTALILPNTYHNPTISLLNPIAITLFLCLLKSLLETHSWRLVAALAALTVLATFAKPSYTIALVPAIALLIGYAFIRRRRGTALTFTAANRAINWKMLVAGILIPAALVLGWQYWFLYGPAGQSTVYGAEQTAGIVLAPLEMYIHHWEIPAAVILPEFLLSILFPLAVYLVYFPQARRDLALNLAWLVFLIGAAYAYLLIEYPYPATGNMTWSGRVTLLVLFVVSTGFFVRQNAGKLFGKEGFNLDWRVGVGAALFLAHLISRVSVLV